MLAKGKVTVSENESGQWVINGIEFDTGTYKSRAEAVLKAYEYQYAIVYPDGYLNRK
jgi:hypothetical protein